MAGNVTATPVVSTTLRPVSFTCLTGFVRRRPQIGIFQRGTHLLVDINGNVIATLRSNTVDLFGLEGRFVTVCGTNEGQIEGVTSLLVTQLLNVPSVTPVPGQIDLRTLLVLLLLTNPNLFATNPQLLQFLLLIQLLGGGTLDTSLATSLGLGTSLGLSTSLGLGSLLGTSGSAGSTAGSSAGSVTGL